MAHYAKVGKHKFVFWLSKLIEQIPIAKYLIMHRNKKKIIKRRYKGNVIMSLGGQLTYLENGMKDWHVEIMELISKEWLEFSNVLMHRISNLLGS
uniref:Uncharacterized protein n=1 Tax=Romanomermis culicivorax TaxID=13658 RepID=A0A915L306_ROMCU